MPGTYNLCFDKKTHIFSSKNLSIFKVIKNVIF